MSVQVRARREASSFLQTYVGAQGELLVDTSNNRVQVHDGATPGGWPAAKLADVIGRTAVVDAAYTALATDRTIAFASLTAARTVTLPAASTYPTGTQLLVVDESGACSPTLTITLARAGTDTINGAATAVLSLAYGYLALVSNGAGKWTIVDQSTASMAQQAANTVAITGGSIGASVGLSSYASSGLSTSANTTLNVFNAGTATGNIDTVRLDYKRSASGGSVWTSAYARLYRNVDSSAMGYVQFGSATLSATQTVEIGFGNSSVLVAQAASIGVAVPLTLPGYTVAGLPAAGTAGRVVWCSNARVFNGAGMLEAAGAGTGGLVTDNGTAWKIAGTNVTVSA